MERLVNNDLTEYLSNKLSDLQRNFFEINWGEAINNAIDTGLKIILPDYMENEIIDIKNAFIEGGLLEAIKKAIELVIGKSKEIIGIFTGNLDNINQAEVIIKNSGIINKIADVLDNIVDKTIKNELINKSIGELIKNGKNIILDNAEKNIDKINKEQIKKIKEINSAIEAWEAAYKKEDFKKMQSEYKKIENRLDNIISIEEIIKKIKKVENLHNLIKNNEKNFDLTDEQKELAEQLI